MSIHQIFFNFLKCPGFGFVFLIKVSLFALLWPFSLDPAFSHATIGRWCTMPARYWSNYFFSVITFSKYENNMKTKPKPGHFRQFRGYIWGKRGRMLTLNSLQDVAPIHHDRIRLREFFWQPYRPHVARHLKSLLQTVSPNLFIFLFFLCVAKKSHQIQFLQILFKLGSYVAWSPIQSHFSKSVSTVNQNKFWEKFEVIC